MANTQKQATQFENDIAAEIWRSTNDHTVVRAGYSGNSVMPLPDIFIRSKDWDTALEIKKSSKKGREEIGVDKEDVRQVWKFSSRNCADTNAVFGFKFSSREPILVSLPYTSSDDLDKVFERLGNQFEKKEHISYREPNEDKYVVEKPDLDSWNSARSGEDMSEKIIDILP